MSLTLHIPCITSHYFQDTAENMRKLCRLANLQIQISENSTCCGLPYFEKGELKAAKGIGEYNLGHIGGNSMICLEQKCRFTFQFHYPKIFNNTVSHNATMQMARQIKGIESLLEHLDIDRLRNTSGNYFLVRECCSNAHFDISALMSKVNWQGSFMKQTCCGAGSSMPVGDRQTSDKMALSLIDEFTASGADAMVFEDDICRKHVENVAEACQVTIKTLNIIDVVANAL